MMKKLFVAICIPFLLNSCISITRYPDVSTPQQDFVTATLAPTAINWMSTATEAPAAETASPVATNLVPATCTNAAILVRDVTIPDDTQVQAGEIFTKTWEFKTREPVPGGITPCGFPPASR